MASEWTYHNDIRNNTPSSYTQPLEEINIVTEVYITSFNLAPYVYSSLEHVLVTVIAPLIFIFGILGNAAVICIFYNVSDIRTTTNFFLMSLAIADIIFLLSAVPAYWGQYLTSPIPLDFSHLGTAYCKVYVYFTDVGIMVSCLTIGLLTIERYVAICWPLLYRGYSDRGRIVFSCCMVWLFSFIYKIPDLFFTDVYQQSTVLVWPEKAMYRDYPTRFSVCNYCQPRDHLPCKRFRYSLALDQILPLIEIPIITILYICVVCELHRLSLNANRNRSATHGNVQDKITVIRMLIITIVVYVICISPLRIINMLDIFGPHISDNAIVFVHVTRMMMYTNSAVNPLLYNLMSDEFRKAFRETFCCRCIPQRAVYENILLSALDSHTNHTRNKQIYELPLVIKPYRQ